MGKHRKTTSRILVNLLLFLNLLAVISLFGSYAAQYIDPREAWVFALFGLLYPWLLILNAGFVFLWLILWKKYALISLVSILIGWKQLNAMISLPGSDPILLPGPNFSLISWNIHGFSGESEVRGNVRPEVTEYLSSEHADVICLQEYRIWEEDSAPIIRRMSDAWGLPFAYVKDYYQTGAPNGVNGIATFTRFPVAGKGTLELSSRKCFGIYTDLVIEQDTLRLFNVHLASLRLGQKDVDFYYHLKKNETENVNIKAGLFSILNKLKLAFHLRARETDKLQEAIRHSPHPVLLCGDLNDSPFSYTYRQLTKHLSDTYLEAGEGFFGSTYDGALPNYRIDYILHDNHLRAFSYTKSDVQFSDHFPVSGLFMMTVN